MRAFLRPVSSPWIVFDRDSRADDFASAALRLGKVFASSPSLVDATGAATAMPAAPQITEAAPSAAPAPMFPASVAEPAVHEPSNLVATRDLDPSTDVGSDLGPTESAPISIPEGIVARRGRVAWIAGACIGAVVLFTASSIMMARLNAKHATLASTSAVDLAANVAPAAAAAAPAGTTLELDEVAPPPAAPAAPVVAPEAPAAAAAATPPPEGEVVGKNATDPKKRWGKLTIKSDAKTRTVWFDGKKMLGSGTRSFMVFCGMHTIAINDKAEQRDIEIPCNGEYTAAGK